MKTNKKSAVPARELCLLATALVVLASMFWNVANATNRDDPDMDQEQQQGQAQGQAQGQGQGQLQGQAQGQETNVDVAGSQADSASSSSATGGNVTVNQNREAQGSYEVKFRNNPNVYTNAPAPTISCYKTGGGGASGGGVGLSFGGGKIDPYCVKREEIRLGFAIGMTVQARFSWCNLENNIELFASVDECLSADTSVVSGEYQLLLKEKERIERELRETQTVLARRCEIAEEGQDRANEAWLECQAGK